MRIIDYWCNLFTPDGIRQGLEQNPDLTHLKSWWKLEDRLKGYEPEAFIELMDRSGIEQIIMPAVVMGSYLHPGHLQVKPLDRILELRDRYPSRIKVLYGINPLRRVEGVRELERVVREHGVIGAHLHPYGFGKAINDRDLYPYYYKCEELGIPVVMQVGHSAEFMPSALGRPILLDEVALYFSNLRIVASHTGWPWSEELIALAWKHPNLYVGCAAHAPKYWDPSLVQFMNSRGIGKVLFGTDFPIIQHEAALEQIRELGLKPQALEALLGGAAARVFGL